MTGLSGTGKSTVAASLARALDAAIFASDVVRKEIARWDGPAPAEWEQGLYTPEQTEATYERLWDLATQTLAAGRTAILDATFLDEQRRERLTAVAQAAGVPLVLVETVCSEETAVERIAARARGCYSPSDVTIKVYRRQRAAVQSSPPTVPRGAVHVLVGTDRQLRRDPVFAALRRAAVLALWVPGT